MTVPQKRATHEAKKAAPTKELLSHAKEKSLPNNPAGLGVLVALKHGVYNPIDWSCNLPFENRKNFGAIQKAHFIVNRHEYDGFEHSKFQSLLNALGPDDLWLDAGAGEARVPFAFCRERGPKNAPHVLALSYTNDLQKIAKEMAADPEFNKVRTNKHPKMRYSHGRFIEEIPEEELGRPKLITDHFGPLHYSPDLGIVLQKYLDILAPGGSLIFNTWPVSFNLKDSKGRAMRFGRWLLQALPKNIFHVEETFLEFSSGQRPKPLRKPARKITYPASICITRKTGSPFKLPRLELGKLSSYGTGVPERVFKAAKR